MDAETLSDAERETDQEQPVGVTRAPATADRPKFTIVSYHAREHAADGESGRLRKRYRCGNPNCHASMGKPLPSAADPTLKASRICPKCGSLNVED